MSNKFFFEYMDFLARNPHRDPAILIHEHLMNLRNLRNGYRPDFYFDETKFIHELNKYKHQLEQEKAMKDQSVQQTIKERGEVYGDYITNTQLSYHLKKMIREAAEKNPIYFLGPQQQEALDMICVKLARIVTGNPHYEDNWRDIAGYAMLGGNLEGGNNNE